MSRKSKGCNAERELIHLFWNNDWGAVRVAGSGSIGWPSPDVLASNRLRKLAIECKASRGKYKYLTKEEVSQLREFSSRFGAEPWIGVKFNNKGWFFLNPEDLKETQKHFVVDTCTAKSKGLSFEEVIKGF
ncbi:Holliday junction resolvase [Candidatus Woesearchaeota archaeon]|nr:Holliday junction resolvase [Candidatus Woesearchaeota archaeon]